MRQLGFCFVHTGSSYQWKEHFVKMHIRQHITSVQGHFLWGKLSRIVSHEGFSSTAAWPLTSQYPRCVICVSFSASHIFCSVLRLSGAQISQFKPHNSHMNSVKSGWLLRDYLRNQSRGSTVHSEQDAPPASAPSELKEAQLKPPPAVSWLRLATSVGAGSCSRWAVPASRRRLQDRWQAGRGGGWAVQGHDPRELIQWERGSSRGGSHRSGCQVSVASWELMRKSWLELHVCSEVMSQC